MTRSDKPSRTIFVTHTWDATPYLVLGDVLEPHEKEGLESVDVFDEALAHDFRQRGNRHQSIFLNAAGFVGRVEHLLRRRDGEEEGEEERKRKAGERKEGKGGRVGRKEKKEGK